MQTQTPSLHVCIAVVPRQRKGLMPHTYVALEIVQ